MHPPTVAIRFGSGTCKDKHKKYVKLMLMFLIPHKNYKQLRRHTKVLCYTITMGRSDNNSIMKTINAHVAVFKLNLSNDNVGQFLDVI